MGMLLDDPLYDRFASRTLCHALYGGADFGECFVTAKQIAPRDAGRAGGHCEETARSLFHQRVYDWLDGVFAGVS